MFCKKCGKEILDDAVVCIHCGCAVEKEVAVTESREKKKINVLCLVGFILGCVSWFLALWGTVALVGLILSIVGLVQANRKGESLKGLGIAGICVSVASVIYTIYVLVVAILLRLAL